MILLCKIILKYIFSAETLIKNNEYKMTKTQNLLQSMIEMIWNIPRYDDLECNNMGRWQGVFAEGRGDL